MSYLSGAGLSADFIGVMLLGFDLVSAQRRLISKAEDRVSRLDFILEEIGGVDGWAETVETDFRQSYYNDGRAKMIDGSFDPDSAGTSFKEALQTISEVGIHVLALARMQHAGMASDRNVASLSFRYSYGGLALITVGFALHLPAFL